MIKSAKPLKTWKIPSPPRPSKRFLCKIWFENAMEMAKISAILFVCPCHRTIIFYFSATATYVTFFSSRQWCGYLM